MLTMDTYVGRDDIRKLTASEKRTVKKKHHKMQRRKNKQEVDSQLSEEPVPFYMDDEIMAQM